MDKTSNRVPSPKRSVPKKLNDEKVREMRRLRRRGLTLKQLAERFEVSVPLVSRTVRESPLHWKHVQ